MNKNFSSWWLLIGAFAGTAALSIFYAINGSFTPNVHAEALGQLGDYFGGFLNPLVSILTLVVAINVWRLQKAELELTRNEMAQTKEAMKEQAKTAEQQRREQRFFDLMTVLKRVEDSIVSSDEKFNGKRAIRSYRGELGISIQQTLRYGLGQTVENEKVTEAVMRHKWHEGVKKTPLPSYLRVLSKILSEAENILGDSRHQYIKLLQAQLSDDELTVIALAIWLDPAWESLKKLVCEYGLLEFLTEPGLKQELQKILPIQAFGGPSAAAQ